MKNDTNNFKLSYLQILLGNDAVQAYEDSLNGIPADDELVKAVQIRLDLMNKYPGNSWWWRVFNEKDLAYMAYFQLQEQIMMVPWLKFLTGLEDLLGRPVEYVELVLNPNLKEEAEKAFQKKLADNK